MGDTAPPSPLMMRLQELRISRGMTIQQMAETSAIPKSSLESYMRMQGAKRPDVDALLAIADGMGVSLDWLVGRAVDNMPAHLGHRDYAMQCFGVFQDFIRWLHERQGASGETIIQNENIAGIPDAELAAKSMVLFMDTLRINNQSSRSDDARRQHWRFYAEIEQLVDGKPGPATGN